MFAEGTLVAGKYRIDRILGRGGMGMVAAATHVLLHQRVAVKCLLPELAANQSIVERFVREARAAAALRSEHVCRVSDVGALDDGTPYLVMELLEGADLAQHLQTSGPVPVHRACSYVLQACIGVAEAHAMGIVHRDLKPANLFLARRPDGTPLVKVLDFGIAKAQSDTGNFSLTQTAGVLGSPGYMSPEQLRSSRDVDLRTDIWSLGVILFELVSGQPPFTAESVTELAIRVWTDPRPPLVGRMPGGFDQVIDGCLAKKPEERYPDLANLAHALATYAGPDGWELANTVSRMLHATGAPRGPASSGIAVTAAPIGYGSGSGAPVATMVVPVPTTLGSSASALPSERSRSGARWGVIGAVAAAILAAAVTYAVVRRTTSSEPAAATQPSQPPSGSPGPPEPATAPVVPAVIVDAAPATVVVALPDAAVAIAPPDAAEVATVPVDAAEPAAVPVNAAPKKKVVKKQRQNPDEDFGASRY